MWRIRVTSADDYTSDHELGPGQHIVGRLPDCDITLNDPQVSRRHCELLASDAEFKVRDLGSGNGIYVNGDRVVEATLTAADRLQIGSWTLTLSE